MIVFPLVSIIVPVFNVDKYLRKCLESIVNQTYSNLEIILVNDGSTDSSLEICEEFQCIDNRIIIINKKNGGLSDARNSGIMVANGKYVSFVDSDDALPINAIENQIKIAEEYLCDVVVSGIEVFHDSRFEIKEYQPKKNTNIFSWYQALEELIYSKKFTVSAWAKLYKTCLFKDNSIFYPVGKLYEDKYTTYKIFLKSKKICYNNFVSYYYRKRPGSITTSTFQKKHLDTVYAAEDFCNDVDLLVPNLSKKAKIMLLRTHLDVFPKTFLSNDSYLKAYSTNSWKAIVKFRKYSLFNFRCSLKTRLLAFSSIFGKRFYIFIFKDFLKQL